MKKNVKIEKKSPLAFKLMFTLIVAVTFAFVWFAGYVFAEKNVEKTTEKTKVVIVMEPQSTAEPVFEVKDDVSAKNIENEVVVEDVVEENEPVVQETSNSNLTQAYVSIVVDDMGISAKHTKEILSIHAPLTSSFLTYGENLNTYAKEALEAGHEIMIHVPMEPMGAADLAPDTLKISMSDDEIKEAFLEMLAKFDGIEVKGINNHMGSLFTQSAPKLDIIMTVLKEKGLFFLDSKTTEYSQALEVSQIDEVPYIARDVFLDNENDYEKIKSRLEETEEIAEKTGFAVAICHPKSQTYEALKDWINGLKDKNIKLIHLSEMIDLKK